MKIKEGKYNITVDSEGVITAIPKKEELTLEAEVKKHPERFESLRGLSWVEFTGLGSNVEVKDWIYNYRLVTNSSIFIITNGRHFEILRRKKN